MLEDQNIRESDRRALLDAIDKRLEEANKDYRKVVRVDGAEEAEPQEDAGDRSTPHERQTEVELHEMKTNNN